MSLQDLLSVTYQLLLGVPKQKIIEAILSLRKAYQELDSKNQELDSANKKLHKENTKLNALINRQKVQNLNKLVNKPSSKQAEW